MDRSHPNSSEKQPRANALELKVPPLAVVGMVAALMWIAAFATPAMDFYLPAKPLWVIALVLVGAVTCASGFVSVRQARTTVNPMKPDTTSSLVVSGIYQYTRNPMYLGLLLVLLGWAAFLTNVTAVALLPVFVVYMNLFQIRPEERVLASLFPHDYPGYRARVRRWF